MGGGGVLLMLLNEFQQLHKSIASYITFKCGVSVSWRTGVALADYFSNSLPGSINSDTNAPSSGGIRSCSPDPT